MTYSSLNSSDSRTFAFNLPDGAEYELGLVPDRDNEGQVVVLNLVMHDLRVPASGGNLLESNENLHGYQSYEFAASDFRKGAGASAYGESRRFRLQEAGVEVRANVVSVDVSKKMGNPQSGLQYRFGTLKLAVTVQKNQ